MRGDEITRASIKRRAFIPGLTKRRLERARAYFFKKKINRRKATTNRDRDYYSWWGWFPRSWNIFFNNDDRNDYYKF